MKKVNIIFLIFWMIVIFMFSHQIGTESSILSSGLIKKGIKIVYSLMNQEISIDKLELYVTNFSFIIRKLAHYSEYLILGILMINMLKDYHVLNRDICLLAILLCIIYACTDEIHQLFIIGRSCQIRDVIIDSCGSLSGVIVYFKLKKHK